MEEKEEATSTFNINIITGDITVPVVSVGPMVVQSAPSQDATAANQMLPPATACVPSSSKIFTGKAKPPSKVRAKENLEKDSEEYIRRRQRNNVAVKKSREKTREKSVYTLQKVEQLKVENEELESKITILTKELGVLKDLFMDHARGFCAGGNLNLLSPEQLESLLGCKVNRKNFDSRADAGTTPGASTSGGLQGGLSTIEPLINAAEIGLGSFQEEETKPTVSEVESTTTKITVIENNFQQKES